MNPFEELNSYSDYEDGDFVKLAFAALSPSNPKKTAIKPDHFTLWSDDEFHYRFRLSKTTVRFILSLIKGHIEAIDDCNVEVFPEQQLLFTLRYFATGTISATCLDFVGIRRSVGNLIVERVCEILAFLRARIIHFPKCPVEIKKIENEFFNIAKIPHCIGVIGCTHVRLTMIDEAKKIETFRNENNFLSLKVQIVCDANSKIENIVARWPGGAQESIIFNNSKLRKLFEDGEMKTSVILGDCAYPLRKYLLTPINNATSVDKVRYNDALDKTLSTLRTTCELWKRRFPVLINGLAGNIEWIQCVIVATTVLHNIACNMGEKIPKITLEEQEKMRLSHIENSRFHVNGKNAEQSPVRDFLVEYFSRLSNQSCNKEATT